MHGLRGVPSGLPSETGKERGEKSAGPGIGARTLQEDVRERSSSGGVFSVLADWVLEREGAVSPPGIWEKYVRFLGRRYGGKIRDFEFRDKRGKDNGHTVSWKNGNTQRAYSLYADPYCRLYFQDLILRPSCYECPFCRPERESDFTIGDFWGLERIRPDLDDGMGNSLVIVHSERAERIWREAARRCLSFECRLEDLLQPRLAAPTPRPAARERFMKWYRLLPFWILLKKYGG